MNAKPTPGPWKLEKFCIWAGDKYVVAATRTGLFEDEQKANAALIVAAVNACFAINPDNPMAVAEALPELVEALRDLVLEHNCPIYGPLKTRAEQWDRAEEALAKLGAKP